MSANVREVRGSCSDTYQGCFGGTTAVSAKNYRESLRAQAQATAHGGSVGSVEKALGDMLYLRVTEHKSKAACVVLGRLLMF